MEASTTMTVTAGESTFSLPADFKCELNPEISDYEGLGYRRLLKVIKDGIDKRDTSDTARPLQYRIWEDQGKWIVQSDDAFSFPMDYYKYFADLDHDSTVPGSDTDFVNFLNKAHEAIEFYALARCYERLLNFDVARYYQNDDRPYGLFEKKLMQLRNEDTEIALANADLQMGYPG